MKENQSCITEIIFLGFSDFQAMKVPVFLVILTFYLIALIGNSLILILTSIDPSLHTPMYFFLRVLAFLELGYTSTITLKTLEHLLTESQIISLVGCKIQLYFFILFGITECCLFSVMAYDRYIAICKPLQYTSIMHVWEHQLAAVPWTIGIVVSFIQAISIFTLPFCGPNRISHFFCDLRPVLRLATTDTFRSEMVVLIVTVIFIAGPFVLILLSYILIIATILRMPRAENRRKAFSTCSSHLIVVSLFYGTTTFTYLRPNSMYSLTSDRVLSVLYTVVIPACNPIIYSLRNREIKSAFMRSVGRKKRAT